MGGARWAAREKEVSLGSKKGGFSRHKQARARGRWGTVGGGRGRSGSPGHTRATTHPSRPTSSESGVRFLCTRRLACMKARAVSACRMSSRIRS